MFSFPSWPRFPSVSLPAFIQRRFLSFILKKAFGHLVKPGQFDPVQIDAQIGTGYVHVNDVELDHDAINKHLAKFPLPFLLQAGSIGKVSVRIPWPNILTAPLALSLSSLSVTFVHNSGVNPKSHSSYARDDLAEPVTFMAESFVHDELSPQENEALLGDFDTDTSPHCHPPGSIDPFLSTENLDASSQERESDDGDEMKDDIDPSAQGISLIATFIERLLARFEFDISEITVRVVLPTKAEFTLHLGGVIYRVEDSPEPSSPPSDGATDDGEVRVVKLTRVSLFIRDLSLPLHPRSIPSPERSVSPDSSSSEENDVTTTSQSLTPLLPSHTTCSLSPESTMYHSAPSSPLSVSSEIASRAAERLAMEERIISVAQGSESITFRLVTPRLAVPYMQRDSTHVSEAKVTRNPRHLVTKLRLTITTGPVAVGLNPIHVRSLIYLSSALASSMPVEHSPNNSRGCLATSLDVVCCIKCVTFLLLPPPQPILASQHETNDLLHEFFLAHSAISSLPRTSHLRLHLDGLEVNSTTVPVVQETFDDTDSVTTGRKFSPDEFKDLLTASISEFSVFSVATSAGQDLLISPVLIPDPNLALQYDDDVKFPSFDVVDRTVAGDIANPTRINQWRVRPSHKRRSHEVALGRTGSPKASHIPTLRACLVSATVERPAVCEVNVVPLHLFVDVGVLEEMFLFLNIAASTSNLTVEHGGVGSKREDQMSPATPRASDHAGQQSNSDMKEKKSDKSTLSDFTSHYDIGHSVSNNVETNVLLRFMFLRFEVRVPTYLSQTSARSGAVVLDMRDVKIMQQRKGSLKSREMYGDDHKERGAGSIVLGTLQFTQLLTAVVLPRASRASSFLSISAQEVLEARPSSLEKDQSVNILSPTTNNPLFPSVCLRSNPVLPHRPSGATSSNIPSSLSVDAHLPTIHVKLSKYILDGLTFWADDVAKCLYGDIERTSKSDTSGRSQDPSMIGSRFFSKRTASTGSSESGDDTRKSELVIKVSIGEALVELLVPRANENGNVRPLNMKVFDTDLLAEFRPEGRDETVITLGIMNVKLCDTSAMGNIETILESTIPHDVIVAFVKLRYISVVDNDTATKESRLKLTISGFTYFLTPDIVWITDLGSFAKAPEGAFESVIPNERTKLSVKIIDGSFHLMGNKDLGALVAYIGELGLSTELVGDSREIVIVSNVLNSCVLFIDDRNSSMTPATNSSNNSSIEYWKRSGYALLADVDDIELRLRHLSEPPVNTQIHVYGVKLKLHLCADSIPAFGSFSDAFFSTFRSDENISPTKPASLHVPQHQKKDDFAAVDEHAFRRVPDLGPAPDMINDDLPKNLDYLDASFGTAAGLRELLDDDLYDFEPYEPGYGWNPSTTILGTGGIISNLGGETIRILDSQGIRVVEGHFENIPREIADFPPGSAEAKLSIRLWNCHLTVSLHDGYDWVRTRKTIEQEVKAIRRRLVKIRQLLASGQTADASIEETSTILFNSVSIGLPRDAEELEPGALIAAIDKELGDDAGSEIAGQSSWQSFRPQTQQEIPRSTELRGRKLERSESSQIDFCLSGVQLESDQYHSEAPLVSRLLIAVKDLEILDHIKTSTWKKFLTVLRTDFRGNVRETGSNMVRIELRIVHPVPDLSSEEGRLRMKVLPLKLHVDQDALDFMKKFFGFQVPGAVAGDSPKSELYFLFSILEHVEVFPVDIKLDYKPKRVDYKALREGRTIELMNFFHFEGSEITLRHITLSGISGWGRLFDTLNDLWTPDVKANQLADIISGVSPVRSLVNVGSGVADLVLLPIAQYKKDKRVVRGVQKGTTSFVKSTAMEALKLGARLATGTQVILEQAENVLGGQGQFRDTVTAETLHSPYLGGNDGGSEVTDLISKYADQPQDLREGMQSAYKSLSKNFNAAAQTILAVPMEVYERSGNEGPVRAIVRAVPIAVLKPMIGASEAVSKTLFGLRNTMDPEINRENEEKYKQR